jgi:hypothetical protein
VFAYGDVRCHEMLDLQRYPPIVDGRVFRRRHLPHPMNVELKM